MAICFIRASIIKRSAGRSAVAAAAYRAGDKLVDLSTGEIHNYTRKTGIDYSEIISPIASSGDNNWLLDRAALWNQVQDGEKRCDAQLSRELIIAIPRELNRVDQIALVQEYVKSSYVDRGMIADLNFHNLNSDNPHSHVMLTMRKLKIDEQGRVTFGNKDRTWNNKKLLATQVKEWEVLANRYLENAGLSDVKIDSRSYEEQGINRIPQVHLGAYSASMRSKGISTRIGDEYDKIEVANHNIRQQLQEIYNDRSAITDLDRECEKLNQQISDLQAEINQDAFILASIAQQKTDKITKPLTSETLIEMIGGDDRVERIAQWCHQNLIIPDGQTEFKRKSDSITTGISAVNVDSRSISYIFMDTIRGEKLIINCCKNSGKILSLTGVVTGAVGSLRKTG